MNLLFPAAASAHGPSSLSSGPLRAAARALTLLAACGALLAPAVRAQLQWSAYDTSGNLVGTASQAASFDAATGTYTFTVPAGTAYTFVTTSFVPITMSAPASGSTVQTISYKMKASVGWTTAVAGNRINQLGLFDYGATAPGETGNFTDDNGLFGNFKGSTWGNELFGGTTTVAGLLGGYQSSIKLGSGKSAGTNTSWTLADDTFVDVTLRVALSSAGAFSLGTSSAYANAGLLVEDSAAVGAGTSYQAIYSGAASAVTAPKTFNEYAFYYRNDATSAATITITNFSGLTPPPYFTAVTGQPPVTQVGSAGDTVTITCSAVGSAIVYQWEKSTDGGTTFTAIDSGANASAATATLTLTNAQSSDEGQYRVVISNGAGSNTSTGCALTIASAAVGPSVQADPQSATILVGGSNTFVVGASGTAPLSYQWQSSTDNGSTWTDISGATSVSHTVADAVLADAGQYRVVVSNSVSSVPSAAATLTVNQVPAITTQPTGGNINAGDSLTLTGEAAIGTPAPTYQWRRNGVAIPGATSATYSITSATGADTGNYTLVATNAAGSATSSTATVNVASTALTLSGATPATGAAGVFPDQSLTLTFSEAVTAGVSGSIRIYDAANPSTPVDTINFLSATARVATASQLALPVQSKTVGGQAGLNYYPVIISGNTVTIYPRDGSLTYGKTYYVTIDEGTLVDGTGAAYAGIADNSTWTFSTKASGPTVGSTFLTVANDGSGDFYTVQGALDFIPASNATPTTIYIKNGTYYEIVSWIGKSNLTFLGQSRAGVIVGYPNNNNFNPAGTAWRAAFSCRGGSTGTVIANLTLKNFTPKTGSQAEVIYLSGTTGMQAIITHVNLLSYQDTLLINGQAYVTDSTIEGDTDFMWGTGPVFFNHCELKALSIQSYYTQVRNPATNHGFVYLDCTFSAAEADSQNPANPVSGCYLGRLDQNSNPHTEMVLLNCLLGDHILPVAWNANGQPTPSGTALTNCTEYNSRRISDNSLVDVSSRAPWSYQWTSPADAAEIANYSSPAYVLGNSWTPSLAPIVLTAPVAATVADGGAATLGVSAIGVPSTLTYQWRKNGVAIAGATSDTYAIGSASSVDAGDYTVVVTNAAGATTSAAAALTVQAAPAITTQPSTVQAVPAGKSVTFSVVTAGSGTIAYQWKKDGNVIDGATGSSLTIATPTSADAGDYVVDVTSDYGTTTSSAGHLTVVGAGGLTWQSYDQGGNRISADAAVFDPATGTYTLTVPANTAYTFVTSSFVPLVLSKPASGSNYLPVTFTMLADGGYGTNGSLQYHYTGFGLFNDGGTAAGASGNFTDDQGLWIELYQSANAVSMKPQSVTSTVPNCPAGLMALDINSPYGMGTGTGGNVGTINDGMAVDLTVRPAASTAGTVTLGTSSSTNAAAGGVLLDHDTGGALLQRRVYSSGSTGLSVASASITFNEFGYQFDNATGSAVTLKLGNFSGLTIAPCFTTQPQSHSTATVGDSLTLTSVAVGAATYQWQISTDGGASYSDIDSSGNASAATAALTLTNLQLADAATYRVVVTNAAGSVASVPTVVDVTASAFAPVIDIQPAGATKLSGTSYTFAVTASASAPATYQWNKDGVAIDGATSASYAIASLTPADAGAYTVTITNGLGSATSDAAALVVQYVPVITSPPAGATVAAGDSVTLAVTVDALPAATYQWKRNGSTIVGATSASYTIAGASASDAGNYTVVVANLAGNVTSSSAAVNVLSTALTLSGSSELSASGGGVYPESPITLTFSQAVTAGISGKIRIYDSADPGTPVDTIDFAASAPRSATAALAALPTKTQTIGTLAGFNYYPVTTSGSTATIYPTNGALTYGRSYYVTIEPGAFLDASGLSFAGVSDGGTITFATKAAAPAAGTTLLTVAKDGSGDFCTLQAALDWIPAANTTPTTIALKDGTYNEIVYWTTKSYLTITGQSRAGTIVGYANNNTLNPQGTNGRAAFEGRNSTGTVLTNLTVKNFTAYGGTQAEAIYFNNTDTAQTMIVGVNLSSFQDTLNVNGPTYVADTYIEGDTDFMWGNGPVYFEDCELKMLHSSTFYTQVRNPATNHGFVYHRCLFSADTGVTGAYLGRINQNAPAYTEVVLLDCREADTAQNVLGWDPNGLTDRSSTLCVEYDPTKQGDGTAMDVSGRVSWSYQWTSPANDAQIADYSDPYWVLNTQKDGTAKVTPTTWTPALAPMIITQPVAASVSGGSAVTLSVSAIGVPGTFTYQWKKDGVDIPGATSATYALASAAGHDTGSYTVVVTNAAGSATSAGAAVAVSDAFTAFAAGHGLDATTGAIDADPDGDGITNLMEFVLGGDPTSANRSILPTSSAATVSAQPALVFDYDVATAAAAIVSVTVEYSTDLTNWTTAVDGQGGITIRTSAVDADTSHVTVTIPTSGTKLFARLHLNY